MFLIKYLSKASRHRLGDPKRTYEYIPYQISLKCMEEVDQETQRGLMSIFFIKYLLKARGSRPGDPKRTYEYIPY